MEESFPRGGVEKSEAKKNKNEKKMFQDGKTKKQKKEKKKGKQKKGEKGKKGAITEGRKKHKMEGEVSGKLGQQQPTYLSRKLLYPGMLMLGYVRQIKNYILNIALPNGLTGSVPITNISQAYTESLQKFSEAQDESVENVSTLSELFKVGMVLPCKLTESDSSEESSNVQTLSINPKDVNDNLSAASLRHGMCIYGNVSSQEDHGYIIDIGVKGVQIFLKNKHASRYIQLYNDGGPLRVGQCVMCKIIMKGDRMSMLTGQNRVINVTIDPLDLKNIENVEADIAFTSLLPGMKVHAKVEKVVKDDGIVVEFNKIRGMIHKSHLPKSPDSYSHADQVTCCILFIHPLTKTVTLTMLPHLTDYVGVPTGLFGNVKVGQTFEETEVKKADKNRGIYLDLKNGFTGFAGLNNFEKTENIQKQFKKGSSHRCRVLGFFPMEALVIVSMKQSVLDEKYMKISDIQPGEMIEVKVKKLYDKGIDVHIGKGVRGFIPTIHLADVTLQHPEQKFKTDDKLRCKVLNVKKKNSMLILTNKKSLIDSKYPVISSYSQVEQGQILEGYICAVKDFGCIVGFYNNVQGLVPRPMLSTEPIQYPEKVFYRGQVVRCKVVHADPISKKLTLTFVIEGKTVFGKKKFEMPKDFKVGKKVKCKVEKKTKTGLDVELLPSKLKAFLPKMHLSDSMEMCNALWDIYQPGDIIEHAMYWHQSKMPLLTCKPCLMSAAENENEFVTNFDSLVPGTMLPGAVKNIMPYGIFVEFANGMFGLVPLQYAVDQRVQDVKAFYKLGQTVVAKVVEVNKEKERFLASLRMQDCYHGNTDIGIEITWNYFKEMEKLLEAYGKMQDKKGMLPPFGSVHKATIKKMSKIGAVCELENGVRAVAVTDHIKGEVSVGEELDCVVLYVDRKQNCVEVSLDKKLTPLVKKRIGKENSQGARVGQLMKSTVELIKEDFVVISLNTSHAKGQFAYLPAKRHWNDVLERHQYTIGQENKVVVKRVEGDVILASLKVHEDKPEEDEDKLNHIPTHSLKIGDICDATIRKIYKDQIYINVGNTHGRVHVTEMVDHVEDVHSPSLKMKKDQEIKVRIIGFRENKSKRYLPVSHPNLKRAMPDCTMKPSILSMEELPANYTCSANNFNIGDKVVTYVDNYSCKYLYTQVSPCVKGRVHQVNMSTNLELLEKPSVHFKNGQCYNATIIGIVNDKLVDLSLLNNPFEEICIGKETRGIITCIKKDTGLVLQLGEGMRGTLDITDMSDNYIDQPTEAFKHGHVITARVLKLEKLSKQAVLTLRPDISEREPVDKRIQNGTDLSRGQIVRGYIGHVSSVGLEIRLGVGVKFVLPANRIVKGKHVTAQTLKKMFKVGDVITVKFLGFDKDNKVELSVLGDTGGQLDIPAEPLADPPSSGQKSAKDRKRSVSNSSADSDVVQAKKTKLKNIETANKINENIELEISGLELMETDVSSERDSTNSSVISDEVAKNADIKEEVDKDWYNLKISVPVIGDEEEDTMERSVIETYDKIVRKEISDSSDDEGVLWSEEVEVEEENTTKFSGKNLSISVTQDGEERNVVSELNDEEVECNIEEDIEDDGYQTKVQSENAESSDNYKEPLVRTKNANQEKNIERKRILSESRREGFTKKRQKTDNDEPEIKFVAKSDIEVSKKPVLEIGEGFSWDTDFKLPTQQQGEISSDDSDNEGEEKQVKKSKEQLRQERKEEENRLYQAEMQRLEGEVRPETADDFDRLVLQSPDSSLVWLRYMAFHLETTEIDKARAIAERALKTISFREEQEKLNVWVAYLNLENMYGTAESVNKVLTRAVQQNDQISIYLQMVNIYVKSGKIEDAEQLFNTLVKKHSGNKDVWIKFGEFYFQQGRVESARKLLQRCLKSLEMKQHVDTIIKFAQMEFKFGEPERGKTMFENTLSTYPKRTDLWSVYIDLVTKLGELETARSIYNRVITHKMSAKKMKFFFKKYLQFEERHGSADQVAEVKKKALQYVESQGFVDE